MTNPEYTGEKLKEILEKHYLWRKGDPTGARADFKGEDLGSVFFGEVDLRGANFEDANLSGADLQGANLSEANLEGADLRWANLQGANLTGTNLYKVNLTGSNLYKANLYEADLTGANLRRVNLYKVNLTGSNLYKVNLGGADLRRANLTGANLTGANLEGADLSGAIGLENLLRQEPAGFNSAETEELVRNLTNILQKEILQILKSKTPPFLEEDLAERFTEAFREAGIILRSEKKREPLLTEAVCMDRFKDLGGGQ